MKADDVRSIAENHDLHRFDRIRTGAEVLSWWLIEEAIRHAFLGRYEFSIDKQVALNVLEEDPSITEGKTPDETLNEAIGVLVEQMGFFVKIDPAKPEIKVNWRGYLTMQEREQYLMQNARNLWSGPTG